MAWATNPPKDGIVSISVGDRIPDVTLRVVTETGAENITGFPFGPEHNIIRN